MTPLQKALEKVKSDEIPVIKVINQHFNEEVGYISVEKVTEILQEMEVDMINECDEKENKTKSTWKESSSQSDYPSQKL